MRQSGRMKDGDHSCTQSGASPMRAKRQEVTELAIQSTVSRTLGVQLLGLAGSDLECLLGPRLNLTSGRACSGEQKKRWKKSLLRCRRTLNEGSRRRSEDAVRGKYGMMARNRYRCFRYSLNRGVEGAREVVLVGREPVRAWVREKEGSVGQREC